MTELEYLASGTAQLQTRRELEDIKQVLDRHGIKDADGLRRVLGRYKRLDRLLAKAHIRLVESGDGDRR